MLITANGKSLLRLHEGGAKLTKYKDTEGIWTIGVGHNLEAEPFFHGSRIPSRITDEYANELFDYDIEIHEKRLLEVYPWVADEVDAVRRDILINMAFNIRNFPKDFPTFFGKIKSRKYREAANFMRSWPWFKQVKSRAVTLCHLMETGEYV